MFEFSFWCDSWEVQKIWGWSSLTFWILLLCVGWGDVCYGGTLWLPSHTRQGSLRVNYASWFCTFPPEFLLKSTSHTFIYLYLWRAKSIAWVLKVFEITHALCFHVLFFFSKEDLGLLDMYVQVILFSNKGFEFNSIHDLGFPSLDLTLRLNICIEIPTPIAT